MEKKNIAKKIFGAIGTLFFFASYHPYLYIILSSVGGVQSGLFGGHYIYGFDAMFNLLQWFIVIPIVPVCFIYQMVFGLLYIRKRKILSIITLILVAGIIAGILLVGIPVELKKKQQFKEDLPVITEYLEEKYGHEMASNITVTLSDSESGSYKVTTPVLPEGSNFYMSIDINIYDQLIPCFLEVNEDYSDRFNDYINSQYDLPDNARFRTEIESIDFGDYKHGDDTSELYDRTEYRITEMDFEAKELNDEIVIGIINDAWSNYFSQIDIPSDTDHLILYIKQNGSFAFSVTIYPDKNGEPATAFINKYYNHTISTNLDNTRIVLDQ